LNEIAEGLIKAIELIITLNPEVMEIAMRSIAISSVSTIIASLICIPVGSLIHFHEFRGKKTLIIIIQTFYSIPTVCVGLLVFLLLSRSGPLGILGLLFTPAGMIVAQIILISPIMLGLSISAFRGVGRAVQDTAVSLGAARFQSLCTIIKEARYALVSAVILGFGRAVSEVGCAMIVGGNIRGFTRVLTTAIALETSIGNFELSIALGIILLCISFIVSLLLNKIQQV
jgi:tungstate transport system permease protein